MTSTVEEQLDLIRAISEVKIVCSEVEKPEAIMSHGGGDDGKVIIVKSGKNLPPMDSWALAEAYVAAGDADEIPVEDLVKFYADHGHLREDKKEKKE